MLDAHALPVQQGVGPAGDVAGCDDTGRGEARGVAHDAVVECEAAAFEPGRLGRDTHPDDDQVGFDRASVGEPHPLDAVAPFEPGDHDAAAKVDAVIAVQPSARVADDRAHCPRQRSREHLQHGDVEAAPAARRRHLRADEPGADHDDARPGLQTGANGEAVVEGAEDEDAVERGSAGQGARARARGDDEAVERQRLAAVELDDPS